MRTEPSKQSGVCADPACQERIHIGDPVIVLELMDGKSRRYFSMHRDCARSYGADLDWSS